MDESAKVFDALKKLAQSGYTGLPDHILIYLPIGFPQKNCVDLKTFNVVYCRDNLLKKLYQHHLGGDLFDNHPDLLEALTKYGRKT